MRFSFIPNEVPEELAFDIKSISEEKWNMISHGLGLLMAILAVPFLLYIAFQSGNNWHILGVAIYSFSLIMVYTSSTLYHSSYHPQLRRNMRTFDHISIYFLIAGSYTPFLLSYVRNKQGLIILAVLWTMVLIGGVFKLFFTHKFKVVSTIAYLIMGWMAVLIIEPIYTALPFSSFLWITIGGAFYTLGCVFYLWKSLYQNHFIWHLFTMGGAISHFIAVYLAIQH